MGHLAFSKGADKTLTVSSESNCGGSRTATLRVLDHTDVLSFHDGNAGVGSSQVDTDDIAYNNQKCTKGVNAGKYHAGISYCN